MTPNGEFTADVEYMIPNGEFTVDVVAETSTVDSPFGNDWDATVVSVNGEVYPIYYLTQDETVQSGKSYYVKNGDKYIVATLTVGDNIKDLGYYEKEEDFVAVDDILHLNRRVAKDTIIRVRYVNTNGTIVFVDYTYKATTIPDEARVVVGNFVKHKLTSDVTYDNTKSYYVLNKGVYSLYQYVDDAQWNVDKANLYEFKPYFNNEITLTDNVEFMGTYKGVYNVEILDGEEFVDVVGDKLIFTQTTEENIVRVAITYADYDNTPTREFVFVVRQGIYFDEDKTSTESGLMTSRRIKTTFKDYGNNVGSVLNIIYEELETGLFKYQIGGLTIYTNDESLLELTFDVTNYVVYDDGTNKDGNPGDEDKLLDAGSNIVVDRASVLEFVHTAQEMPVKMTINVKNEDVSYATRDFFITVIQTYSRLDAVYCVDGADHENVPGYALDGNDKIQYSIDLLHNKLLTEDANLSRTRFILLGTKFDADSNKFLPIEETVNLSAMGFATIGNPNYIEFTVGSNASIKNNSTIYFNQVTKNTDCYVYLNNKAGMETNSVWYLYQIMASDKADGLSFEKTNGYHEIKADNTEYISFLTNDTDSTKTYTSDLYIIGSMLDEKNFSEFNVSVDASISSECSKVVDGKLVDGSTIINKKGKVQPSSDKENDYVNAIQYKFTVTGSNNVYYLTYNLDENIIELIFIRAENTTINSQNVLKLNIGGVNGEKTIVEGLEIVLSNYQISSKFEDSTDTSIYAGYIIDLSDKINNDNADISYVLEEVVYTVDGKEKRSSLYDNNLFKMVDKSILTKAVGSDVRSTLNLIAYANDYALKQITYNFTVKRNFQLIANGEALIENASLETDFILTTAKDVDGTNGFPIQINFIAGASVTKTGVESELDISTADDINYYRVLAFDLYKLKQQGSGLPLLMPKNDVVVTLNSTIESGVLEITNSYIKFYKDYTGDIELTLSVKTGNGTYAVDWMIHVNGIKNQAYVSKDPDFARMENSSLPFISGTSVDVIMTESGNGNGVAVTMKNAPKWANSSVSLTYKYDYVINTFNNDTVKFSNKDLFERGNELIDSYQGGTSETQTKTDVVNKLSTVLPSVPATDLDTQQSYLVTYKIYVEYLSLTYSNVASNNLVKVFYVSYRVINYQQVNNYNFGTNNEYSSADIDVKNDLTSNKLDLFYYVHSYLDCKFEYVNGVVQLKVSGTTYTYDETKNTDAHPDLRYFVEGGAVKYSFNIKDNIIYNESNVEITGGSWAIDPKYDVGNIYSVFESNFSNIFEYKEFIDKYLNVDNSVQIYDKENKKIYNFKLVHIENGRYGIDLSTQFNAGNKFKNELKAELKLIEADVATITVPAYSSENKNGFRLTTTDKIIAKTREGAGVKLSEMFLQIHFVDNDLTDNVTIDTSIIGVGSAADVSWVTTIGGGTITKSIPDPDKTFATIKIPSGIGTYNEYTVKKVVYSAGGADLYMLEQEYYYITSQEVVVPDYRAVGIEDWLYSVSYKKDATQTDLNNLPEYVQSMNLTKAFRIWKMKTTGLDYDNATIFNNLLDDTEDIDDLEMKSYKVGEDSAYFLAIETSVLDNYKKQYPNKTYYEPINFTIEVKVGDSFIAFSCDIVFELPEYVGLDAVFADPTTDLTVNLNGQIYVPIKHGDNIEYEALTTSHSYSIYEEEKYLKVYEKGILTFDSEKIETYFEETNSEELRILCELTTQDGTLEFEVVVKKPAA